MDVFDLSAILRLDSTQYEKGLTDAENKANSFGSRVKSGFSTAAKMGAATVGAAVAVAGGFAKAAKSTAAYGDNVDKTSQKLGLSAEAFQKWDYVMKIAGTDMNSMGMGLKTLTNKLDDAKNGSSEAQEMFGKLGLSMEELGDMSREEVFEATIKGFQGLEDSTERAALANDLFGRSGQALAPLFNQTAEKTEEQMKLAEKYGMVMPDAAVKASAAFQDSLTTMQMTFTGLKNRLMGEFLPSITQVTDGLAAVFAGDYDEGLAKIDEGISGFVSKMSTVLPKMIELGGQIVSSLGSAIVQNLPVLLGATTQMITSLVTGIIENLPLIITSMGEAIVAIAQALADGIPQIVQALQEGMPEILAAGQQVFSMFAKGIAEHGPELVGKAAKWIANIVQGIIENIPEAINSLISMHDGMMTWIESNFPTWIQKGGELLKNLAQGLIENLPEILGALMRLGEYMIENLGEVALMLLEGGVELMASLAEGILNGIANLVGPAASEIVGRIMAPVNAVKGALSGAWASIRSTASSAWNSIKSAASSVWNGIKTAVQTPINALKGLLSGLWNGIKSTASSAWEGIKSAITKPIETAKNTVSNVIRSIKSLFPISLGKIFKGIINLPSIKVHKGKDGGASTSSDTKTQYFAKAMNQPYLFTRPTIINQVAGEAGDEVLYGKNRLMEDITKAVQSSSNVVVNLNYDASDDANDMLNDLYRGILRYKMAGVI